MTADDELELDFPPLEPIPMLSAGGRMRVRQQQQVTNGVHPLTRGPLHAEASRQRSAGTSGQRDPFSCGSCAHLGIVGRGGPRSYAKCLVGDGQRVTSGPATDVRRWWPACPAYERSDDR